MISVDFFVLWTGDRSSKDQPRWHKRRNDGHATSIASGGWISTPRGSKTLVPLAWNLHLFHKYNPTDLRHLRGPDDLAIEEFRSMRVKV
jgi:hypothetical protein